MFQGLLFFLRQGWRFDKRYVLWNIFFQLVNAPLPILASVLPKLIIDELMGQKRVARLLLYIVIFAGSTFVATALSNYFLGDGFTRRCRVAAEFDSDLHRRLFECDFENLQSPHFLELQEKAKNFLYCRWHGFGYLLDCALNIGGYLVTLAGVVTLLAALDFWLVGGFLLLSLLGAAFEASVKRKIKQLDDTIVSDQRGWTYFASLFEKAEFGKEFRIYGVGTWLLAKEREFFSRAIGTMKRQNDLQIRSGTLTAFLTLLQQLIAYGYLIFCVLRGGLTIGDFTLYLSAITVFASTFRQVMSALVEIRSYDMYYENLNEYLAFPTTLRSGKQPIPEAREHTVEFRNVSFKYRGSEQFALKNINLRLIPGQKLLIVGENGAGKSTLVHLLLRLYDPTEGEILLDGIDIRTMEYDRYLSLFATVFQDSQLFSFSLAENVAMSDVDDPERLTQILRAVGLGGKLDQLPGGIFTQIHKNFDETGIEPSGGEAQKIAIARALYKNSPFVILDEPTAALDPRAEVEIFRQFHHLVEGKTAIYISHRLSSAKFSDRIAVLEQGRLLEYGTHDELLQKNGKYAELFHTQADFYL